MTTVATSSTHLLIARRPVSRLEPGKAKRRQRQFPDEAAVDRAIARWRDDGFDVFWVYGPTTPDDAERPLLRQFSERTTST